MNWNTQYTALKAGMQTIKKRKESTKCSRMLVTSRKNLTSKFNSYLKKRNESGIA